MQDTESDTGYDTRRGLPDGTLARVSQTQDILNYFRMPIDNGTVEGLNNKAKLVIRKTYGFRTAKTYTRNLYHLSLSGRPSIAQNRAYICVRNQLSM